MQSVLPLPTMQSVNAKVLGVLVVSLSNGLPQFHYIGEANVASPMGLLSEPTESPETIESGVKPVMAIAPDAPVQPRRGRGRPKKVVAAAAPSPTIAATILDGDDIEEPLHDPGEVVPTTTSKSRGKRGAKAASGASTEKKPQFKGKPMVPQMQPQKGAREAMIRTKAGKEMQVWVLEETIKGYKVLNPDKKSKCPKGFLFGCVWTVKPESFIKYL